MIPLDGRIARVRHMEALFDRALDGDRSVLPELEAYYFSPLWLDDYHADAQGLLPPGLKRGILSQDGFYNFLTDLADPPSPAEE